MRYPALETTMEKIARIYANKRDIQAVPGSCFATDGQKIYYVPMPDNTDPYILQKSKYGFLHEKDHCVFTDFTDLKAGKIKGSLHSILNALEDTRIERLGAREWKGQVRLARDILKEIVRKEINSRFADPSVSVFKKVLDLLYLRVKEKELGDLGLIVPSKIQQLFKEKVGDQMPAILKADTQKDLEKIGRILYKRMKDLNPPPPPPQKQNGKPQKSSGQGQSGESDDSDGQSGKSDDSNKNKKSKKEKNDSKDDEADGKDKQEEGDGQSDEPSSGNESEDKESGEDSGDEEGSGSGSEFDNRDNDEGSGDGSGEDSDPEDQDSGDSDAGGDGSESGNQAGDSSGDQSENQETDDSGESDGNGSGSDDDSGEEDNAGGDDSDSGEGDSEEGPDSVPPECGGSDGDEGSGLKGSPNGSGEDIDEERKDLAEQVTDDNEESTINDDIEKDVEAHAESVGIYRDANGLKEDIRRYDGADYIVKNYENSGKEMLGGNAGKFKRLFISMRAPKMTKLQRSGRLDLQRVWNDDTDSIFQRRQPGILEHSAVSMVIDNSGSMDGLKAHIASSVLAFMARELDRLRIPFECMGFTTCNCIGSLIDGVRNWPILINMIKEFNEPYRKVRHHFQWPQGWTKGTVEFPCIRYAAQRLIYRDETKKVLFILSDGESSCPDPMMEAMIEYIQRLIKAGVIVVGIGIQNGAIANYVPDTIVIRDLNRLAPEIFNKLTRILLKEGR